MVQNNPKTAKRIMDYGLWIMDYELWIMDYGLWIMNYGLFKVIQLCALVATYDL
jgi:hypothetical protein